MPGPGDAWPELRYEALKGSLYAVHRWTQILGKMRLVSTPLVNHWWNATLHVTAYGLSTGLIPSGDEAFEVELDLLEHELRIFTSRGQKVSTSLVPMSVALFYRELRDALASVGMPVPHFAETPNEVATAIPFRGDTEVRPYDREQARRVAAALLQTQLVFDRFRAGFLGKASPVQFFWGGFDLASARFSGKRGPAYGGGVPPHVRAHVMHEAYSHELIATGFWFGDADAPRAEYYCYAMPALDGLAQARIEPTGAVWDADRGEFLLPYEAVRASADPAAALLAFCESTYAAAADVAQWDRALLEQRVRDTDEVPPVKRQRTHH